MLNTNGTTVTLAVTLDACGLELLASVIVFAVNIGGILAHLVRPRIEPLAFKPAPERNV